MVHILLGVFVSLILFLFDISAVLINAERQSLASGSGIYQTFQFTKLYKQNFLTSKVMTVTGGYSLLYCQMCCCFIAIVIFMSCHSAFDEHFVRCFRLFLTVVFAVAVPKDAI